MRARGVEPRLPHPQSRIIFCAARSAADSGLSLAAAGAINIRRCVAAVVLGEPDINSGQFRGLPGPAERAVAPKVTTLASDAPPEICSGVQMGPGATPLTRMPLGPSCLARDFTKFCVTALV